LIEIGDLPTALQPKILRVLQERNRRVGSEKTLKVDVRILPQTSRNLEHLVSQGKFREDLYSGDVYPFFAPIRREKETYRSHEHFLNNSTEKTPVPFMEKRLTVF